MYYRTATAQQGNQRPKLLRATQGKINTVQTRELQRANPAKVLRSEAAACRKPRNRAYKSVGWRNYSNTPCEFFLSTLAMMGRNHQPSAPPSAPRSDKASRVQACSRRYDSHASHPHRQSAGLVTILPDSGLVSAVSASDMAATCRKRRIQSVDTAAFCGSCLLSLTACRSGTLHA